MGEGISAGAAVAVSAAAELAAGQAAPGHPGMHTCCPACRISQSDLNRQPRTIKTAQPMTLSGSGAGQVSLGGPNRGYRWTVRRVSVLDAGGLSVSMGAAIAGVYSGVKGTGQVLPPNLEWIISPLPNAATWGTEYLTLEYGEDLVIAITGGNANEAVIVSCAYQLYAADRRRLEV